MKQLFDFTRVADRGEFWTVQLITAVLQIMLLSMMANAPGAVWLIVIAILAMVIVQLATLVARIRDTGNNVLWILACFIPYIGLVAWIVFGCLESKKS
tara:strand:+ start:18 stop:311 length:294 start_codon:yes stop_codon:yes gene_type:complete